MVIGFKRIMHCSWCVLDFMNVSVRKKIDLLILYQLLLHLPILRLHAVSRGNLTKVCIKYSDPSY